MTYDGTNLEEVLEAHRRFLRTGNSDDRANFDGADLRAVDLSYADLRCASMIGVNFAGAMLKDLILRDADCARACFSGSTLHDVDLSYAALYCADFNNADLHRVLLMNANCCKASFVNANILGCIFWYADLCLADFRKANNIIGTEFYKAELVNAVNAPYVCMSCPETGPFIAWKKCMSGDGARHLIVKLLIPDDAKRLSTPDLKCRANKAEVLEIQTIDGQVLPDAQAISIYDGTFIYRVWQTVYPLFFDENRFVKCSGGIHFFMNRQDAVNY